MGGFKHLLLTILIITFVLSRFFHPELTRIKFLYQGKTIAEQTIQYHLGHADDYIDDKQVIAESLDILAESKASYLAEFINDEGLDIRFDIPQTPDVAAVYISSNLPLYKPGTIIIHNRYKNISSNVLAGIIAHEATHAFLYEPGEEPSLEQEFEACKVQAAEKNNVMKSLVALAQTDKELMRMVERVSAPLAKVATVTTKDLGLPEFLLEGLGDISVDIFRPSVFNPKQPVVTTLEKGKKSYYWLDQDLFEAAVALDVEDMNFLVRLLSYPARTLRLGATLALEFMGRNPVRDQFTAMAYSEFGYKPGYDLLRGFTEVLGKSEDYQLWRRTAGPHAVLISFDRNYIRGNKRALFESKWKNIGKNPIEALRAIAELGEELTRYGEFKRGLEKGVSPERAAYASKEVTLNFARMGAKTRALNAIVAFWNPSVQGIDKMARAFKNNPKRTMFRVAMGITLPSIILYLAQKDDERYKEIPEWERRYYWIILTEKNIYRIPKPFELGLIFGSGAEVILESIEKDDPKPVKDLSSMLLSESIPLPIPTAATPWLEVFTNKSFFRKRPLVGETLKRLLPSEQYYRYTPEAAKLIGKYLNISPIKVENVIRGYTGGLGGLGMEILNIPLRAFAKRPPKPEGTLADVPGLRAFVTREPVGFRAEALQRFYENMDDIVAYEQTIKKMQKEGRYKDALVIKKAHPEYLKASYFRKVSKEMAEIRRRGEKTFNSKTISPESKKRILRGLDIQILNIAKRANQVMKSSKR